MFKRRGTVPALATLLPHERRVLDGAPRHTLDVLRRMEILEPEQGAWPLFIGRLLMTRGDAMDARDALEAAALLAPADPRVYAHLALWYEAALLCAAVAGDTVTLPPCADLTGGVSIRSFAHLGEPLSVQELASRAVELFNATLRFRLPAEDVEYLRQHLTAVRDASTRHPGITKTLAPTA